MLCRKCLVVMETGTTYEQNKENGKSLARRYHECKKCNNRVYTKEPNFQEYMDEAVKKNKYI